MLSLASIFMSFQKWWGQMSSWTVRSRRHERGRAVNPEGSTSSHNMRARNHVGLEGAAADEKEEEEEAASTACFGSKTVSAYC